MERPFQKDPGSKPIRETDKPQEERPVGEVSLVSTCTLIWRVLSGRRFAIPDADMPDVAQEALMRLWRWSEKYLDKSGRMTMEEWDSFTAKTAHNEVNRFLSNRIHAGEVPLDETSVMLIRTPEGNTDSEVVSLVAEVWQAICCLRLYQRRALLLNSSELLIYLRQFGISEPAIVASLELSKEDWLRISGRLPLSDEEIAVIARSPKKGRDPKAAARAIKKARFDARRKLGRLRK